MFHIYLLQIRFAPLKSYQDMRVLIVETIPSQAQPFFFSFVIFQDMVLHGDFMKPFM